MVGLDIAALTAVTPARFVVYAGVPLSTTAWLNTIVMTDPALAMLAIPIGIACCIGRVCPLSRRLRVFFWFLVIALGMGKLLCG